MKPSVVVSVVAVALVVIGLGKMAEIPAAVDAPVAAVSDETFIPLPDEATVFVPPTVPAEDCIDAPVAAVSQPVCPDVVFPVPDKPICPPNIAKSSPQLINGMCEKAFEKWFALVLWQDAHDETCVVCRKAPSKNLRFPPYCDECLSKRRAFAIWYAEHLRHCDLCQSLDCRSLDYSDCSSCADDDGCGRPLGKALLAPARAAGKVVAVPVHVVGRVGRTAIRPVRFIGRIFGRRR